MSVKIEIGSFKGRLRISTGSSLLLVTLLLASMGRLAFCTPADEDVLQRSVPPILLKKCAPCHTTSALGGLQVDSRQNLLKGGKSGPAIVPGKPEASLLIRAISSTDDRLKMPMGAEKLSVQQISDITAWVKKGAPWPKNDVSPAAEEFFETHIRPILAKNCFACHTDSQLGGLRVDSRDSLLKGGKSGPAIIPGKPDESLLIKAVTHGDERLKMPMAGQKLSEEQISDLANWIRNGVYWPQHEVFAAATGSGGFAITPEQKGFWSFRPLSKPDLPKVRAKSWIKGPIDYFILARQEAQDLQPVRMAEKRALIRRATFDLIGLPPAPEEVNAFLQDVSPDAFSRVVERLLVSPHYGERWGRMWLDIARYAEDDVRGAKQEEYPNAFRYRDWVINAFNQDKPYDLFVKEQIAGDLMQKKGGREYESMAATGFFGAGPWYYDTAVPPLARANERNERIDVVTRGFLGLTVACARCHNHKYDPISINDYYALAGVFSGMEYAEYPLVPEKVVANFKQHETEEEEAKAALKDFLSRQRSDLAEIFANSTSQYVVATWIVLRGPKLTAKDCAAGEKLDLETLERWITYLKKPQHDHPYLDNWAKLLTRTGSREEATSAGDEFQRMLLSTLAQQKEVDEDNRPLLREAEAARKERHKGVLLPNLFVVYDDYSPNSSLTLKSLPNDLAVLWRDIFGEKGVLIYTDKSLDRFLSGEWKSRLDSLRNRVDALTKTKPAKYPLIHGVADVPHPGNLKLHIRGNPENLGEEVPRRFLAILSRGDPVPFQHGSGRLELAEAIVSHPLFARVIVNWIWQQHFGRGIVGTPDNFGLIGERPTHPELLEYLATRLIENKWSIKALHREIMLSATYQLSSGSSERNAAVDPDNRLHWRANLRRLDAEAIRDALLAVSGNLDSKIGGPSADLTPDNTRRTIYCKVSRFKLNEMQAMFDLPEPTATSARRNVTNVPLQGLFFLNSALVQRQAELLANRLLADDTASDTARLQTAYSLLYGREASDREQSVALEFLATVRKDSANSLKAWTELTQALLSASEFIYLD
jgi:mono/diheme cytochrome c family protein